MNLIFFGFRSQLPSDRVRVSCGLRPGRLWRPDRGPRLHGAPGVRGPPVSGGVPRQPHQEDAGIIQVGGIHGPTGHFTQNLSIDAFWTKFYLR